MQPATKARIDRRGSPVIKQTGAAKSPAKARVETTTTVLTLPPGTSVASSNATPGAAPWVATLSKPAELRTETRTETVTGAETPEPPPPPSPVEIAKGKGVTWFYGAAALCAVLAVVSFVRKYLYAGLCFGAGALALPLGVNLVSSELVIRCAIGLAVAGVVFVAAWKILAARHGLAEKTAQ